MIPLDDIAGDPPSGEDLEPYHGAAVVAGEVVYWSASSLELGDPLSDGGCNLKYHKRYVQRLRVLDDTAATDIGKILHKENADYLTTGVRALGPLAMTGLHLLPDPALVAAGSILVEHRIDFGPLRAAGRPFVGAIDIVNLTGQNRGGTEIEEMYDPPGTVEMIDHKSTGETAVKAARYGSHMKLGRELENTIQMATYGMHGVLAYDAPHVRLSHHYYFKAMKRAAEKRTCLVPAERLVRRWESIEAHARTLIDVAREPDEKKIAPNLSACGAFGGCPYRTTCDAGSRSILSSMFGGPSAGKEKADMGILDSLCEDTVPATTPAPAVPAAPAILAEPPNALRAAWEYILASPSGRPNLRGDARLAIAAMYDEDAITPAGKLAGWPCHTAADVLELADKMRAKAAKAAEGAALVAPPAPADTIPATPSAPAVSIPDAGSTASSPSAEGAPAAKRRGRPPKAKPEGAPPLAHPLDRPVSVLMPECADMLPPDTYRVEPATAITLFVDCTPSRGAIDLGPAVAEWCERAAKAAGDLDIRLSENKAFAFMKWKGWLAVCAVEHVKPGRYYLDTRGSEFADVVAGALRSVCESSGGEYVRGVR